MNHVLNAKKVSALVKEQRRLWLSAYARHEALDEASMIKINNIQLAAEAAAAAVRDEEQLAEQFSKTFGASLEVARVKNTI